MLRTELATSGRVTSRIGLGMATLMRESRLRRRSHVLNAALDLGIRHFDVAPLYGLGRAEPELGRFLASAGLDDVTVASKFGLTPGRKAQLIAPIQGPIRAAMRRSQFIRRLGKTAERTAGAADSLGPDLLAESVSRSVDLLGRPLDVLILHEVRWSSAWAHAWPGILKGPGYGGLGASGTSDILDGYPQDALAQLQVIQAPPMAVDGADGQRIHHSVLSEFAPVVWKRIQGLTTAERSTLSDVVGAGLDHHLTVLAIAVGVLLAEDTHSIVLVGTTKAENLYTLVPFAQRIAATLKTTDPAVQGVAFRLLDR